MPVPLAAALTTLSVSAFIRQRKDELHNDIGPRVIRFLEENKMAFTSERLLEKVGATGRVPPKALGQYLRQKRAEGIVCATQQSIKPTQHPARKWYHSKWLETTTRADKPADTGAGA